MNRPNPLRRGAAQMRKLHGLGLVKEGNTMQAKEFLKSISLLVAKEAETRSCHCWAPV
jgi:hypothetical protein